MKLVIPAYGPHVAEILVGLNLVVDKIVGIVLVSDVTSTQGGTWATAGVVITSACVARGEVAHAVLIVSVSVEKLY